MSPFKEDPRIRELLNRVARLDAENARPTREATTLADELDDTRDKLDDTRCELEMYQMAIADDEWHRREIQTLHEFVADVRLGIRDLGEYEEVWRRAGLVT